MIGWLPAPVDHDPGPLAPVYVPEDWRNIRRPDPLPSEEKARARLAAVKAVQRYPGAPGLILAEACRAYEELGWLAQPSSVVRRLIDDLLG